LSGGPVARAKPQVLKPQAPAPATAADRGVSLTGSRRDPLRRHRPAGPRQQRGLLDLLRDRAGGDHSSPYAWAAGGGRDLGARPHRDRLLERAALARHGRDRHRRRRLWAQLLCVRAGGVLRWPMRGVRALDLGADRPRDAQGAGIAAAIDRTTRAAEDESLVGWAKVRSTPAYLSTSTAQHRAHATKKR